MVMPTPPNMAYPVPPARQRMSPAARLLVVALVVIFCIATLSVVANILMFLKNNAQENDLNGKISDLQSKNSSMSSDISALQADKATLQGKLDSLESTDITAIKGDITQLQDATKVPDVKFTISSLDLTFDDYYSDIDYYYGNATITCSDISSDYEILVKQTLNSGGSPYKDKVEYSLINIVNGAGVYYTEDDAAKGKLIKPDYTLEVIGFIQLDNMPK